VNDYAEPIARLIDELRRMPGIGQKTAQRLAYSLLRRPREDAERLSRAIMDVKEKIRYCSRCNNFSDRDPCDFCTSPTARRKSSVSWKSPTIFYRSKGPASITANITSCTARCRRSTASVRRNSS